MAKIVFLATILVFLIVADVSNAAFFSHFRKLAAPSPKQDPNVAPTPSPVANANQSSTVGDEKKGKEKENEKEKQPSPAVNAEVNKPKVNQEKNISAPTPAANDNKESKTPKEEVTDKEKSKPNLPPVSKESCSGVNVKCRDAKSMIACVKSIDHASKGLALLIQNLGDHSIKVDLSIPPSLNKQKLIDVPKLQTGSVNVPLPDAETNEIRLNAGNGDCILHLNPPAWQDNIFQHLPSSYSKFMTPIYGAYFLFLIFLIAGGVWACCWFGKRKAQSEVQYQELEMSVPETAAVAETAEGWDQDWDDDWDEENAVKSPGARNISANGLTSRTPNRDKDGWEGDD